MKPVLTMLAALAWSSCVAQEPATPQSARSAAEVGVVKVFKSGHVRDDRWLYFLSEDGDIERSRIDPETGRSVVELVAKAGVRREPGYLYFIDVDGDVAREFTGQR